MEQSSQICHACDHSMVRNSKPDTLEYKDHQTVIDQPGWYCDSCDEVVLDAQDMLIMEKAYHDLKAGVENLFTSDEVKRVRQRLHLSQRKASELLGGGPRSFQRYENGTVMVSRSMNNLLKLLDKNPNRLQDLGSNHYH